MGLIPFAGYQASLCNEATGEVRQLEIPVHFRAGKAPSVVMGELVHWWAGVAADLEGRVHAASVFALLGNVGMAFILAAEWARKDRPIDLE